MVSACLKADAITLIAGISLRQRSAYPKPFKAQVVQECLKPGASVSSVAISHGINANVIHKWLPIYRDKPAAPLPAFVPLQPMPKQHAEVLVHDGVGIWLAARRLNQGKFHWPGTHRGLEVGLDAERLQALVLGLPWQRVGANGVITLL